MWYTRVINLIFYIIMVSADITDVLAGANFESYRQAQRAQQQQQEEASQAVSEIRQQGTERGPVYADPNTVWGRIQTFFGYGVIETQAGMFRPEKLADNQ